MNVAKLSPCESAEDILANARTSEPIEPPILEHPRVHQDYGLAAAGWNVRRDCIAHAMTTVADPYIRGDHGLSAAGRYVRKDCIEPAMTMLAEFHIRQDNDLEGWDVRGDSLRKDDVKTSAPTSATPYSAQSAVAYPLNKIA